MKRAGTTLPFIVDVPAPAGRIPSKQEPTKEKLPQTDPAEFRQRGLAAIAAADMIQAKRRRMRLIFEAYLSGKGIPTIARENNFSKSTVSLHLHELEKMLGAAVLRRTVKRSVPAVMRGKLHAESGQGQRLKRGSVRGWHSFWVTFVPRALTAGMPEELVRRVTGHTAVDVVRKHYFHPGREEFRREFEKAMPGLLMNGVKSRYDQLREILAGMTAKTWRNDRERLIQQLMV